jgi:transcriptional regulator with XRE-family HTH domain
MDDLNSATSITPPPFDVIGVLGENLRRRRTRRGLSLERLSKASGVSRAMLGQIELGRSSPTVGVLWKIAQALELPITALMSAPESHATIVLPEAEAKVLVSGDKRFSSRALFPAAARNRTEFYELRLGPAVIERFEPLPHGAFGNLVVLRGRLEILLRNQTYRLERGDAFFYEADLPHQFRNTEAEEAVIYQVISREDAN